MRYLEILAAVAIAFALVYVAWPNITIDWDRREQVAAMSAMRGLGGALVTYIGQHDGLFPAEAAKGGDTWAAAAKPENQTVWYNALPWLLGSRGVGLCQGRPREFYAKRNILFLPGARYPDTATKLRTPMFAIAINSKLFREDHATKEVVSPKLSSITDPARTVAFLEQGLPDEKKVTPLQPNYDGSCKGSAKSFVARYGGKGIVTFVDGHVESLEGKDVLTETGAFPFPQTSIVWTVTPDENPNQ